MARIRTLVSLIVAATVVSVAPLVPSTATPSAVAMAATPLVPSGLKVDPCAGSCSPMVTGSTQPTLSASVPVGDRSGLTGTVQVRAASDGVLVAEHEWIPVASDGGMLMYVPSGALGNHETYEFRAGTTDGNTTAWSSWVSFGVESDVLPATRGQLDQSYPSGAVLRVAGDGIYNNGDDNCVPVPDDLCTVFWLKYGSGELTAAVAYDYRAIINRHGVKQILQGGFSSVLYDTLNPCDAVRKYCYSSVDGDIYRTRRSDGTSELVWSKQNHADLYGECAGARYLTVDGSGNPYFMGEACGLGSTPESIFKYDLSTGKTTLVAGAEFGSRELGTDPRGFELENVHGLAVDGAGNLLVSEAARGHVLMITGIGDMNPPIPDPQTYGGCGNSASGANPSACISDPVNTATGAFVHSETDLTMKGLGVGLNLSRTYTSADSRIGSFGRGWTSDLDANLALVGTASAPTAVTLTDTTGQRLTFNRAGTRYEGTPGVLATLRQRVGGWELVRRDRRLLRFDTAGKLTAVLDPNGAGLQVQYTNGLIDSIVDGSGRTIDVQTGTGGRIAAVVLPDGRRTSYTYSGDRLVSFTDARGGVTQYEYDAASLMTRIADARGNDVVRNEYGPTGRIIRQLDPLGNPSSFTWDAERQISTMTDAEGGVWTDQYSGNALLSRTDPLGRTTTHRYDADLNVISTTDARGGQVGMVYDARSNLVQRVSATGATQSSTYDAANNLLSETDPVGNKTQYRYDATGNVTEIVDPAGGSTTYDRDPLRRQLVTTITDPRNKTTTLSYDNQANLTSVTSASGAVTKYQYDVTGRQTAVIDPRGNVAGTDPALFTTTRTYDANDNLTSTTSPLGHATTQTFDPVDNLKTQTDAAGHTTTNTYNAANELTQTQSSAGTSEHSYTVRGELAESTDEAGARTSYRYDLAGQLSKVIAPRGNTAGATPADYATTFERDAVGNVVQTTEPGGRVTKNEYDLDGRRTATVDPLNRRTVLKYDAAARLVSTVDPLSAETKYTYDALGRITATIDPLGHETKRQYDANGNLTSLTDPVGGVQRRTYDVDNRVESMTSARGAAAGANPENFRTTFEYDLSGNLTAETDPLGNITRHTYDRDNRQAARIDARGETTTFDLDQLNRITKVTDPVGAVTKYEYNAAGYLTARVDPNNGRTTFEYDPIGRETERKDPLGNRRTAAYDANGNLARTTNATANAANNPNLGQTDYVYDVADRLTAINYPDTTPDVNYVYDAADNRTKMTEVPSTGCPPLGGCAAQTYTYDAKNQLTKVTRSGTSFVYTYDLAGRVTKRQQPGGTAITYAYDNADRMLTASIGTLVTAYTWDPDSNLLTTSQPNGVVETRGYDRAGRTSSITTVKGTTSLGSISFERDENGAPLTVTTPAETANYTYDAAGQIQTACYAATACATPQYRYTYDPAGNILTKVQPSGTTTYTYDAAGQLNRATTGPAVTNYAYNADGQPTTVGARTFTYNAAGRVATTTEGTAKTTYTYDGDGYRVKAVTGSGLSSTTSKLVWDINAALPQLATYVKGSATTRYYYGQGLIRQTAGSTNLYFLKDDLSSITGTISNTGIVQRKISYDPFGGLRAETASPTTAPATSVRYTGEFQDELGKYYLRARTYDAGTGRFDTRDPLDAMVGETSQSPYVYARNAPTQLTDPSGLRPEYDSGCTLSMLAGYYDPFSFGLVSKTADKIAGLFGGGIDQHCADAGRILGSIIGLATLPTAIRGGGISRVGGLSEQTSSLGGPVAATAGTRLAQDIAVSPVAPSALGLGRSIGRASHNQALQAEIAALPRGATGIRVNQQQVNALGQRVGINRPDLQYTLNGQRYYIEYEGLANPRGALHEARILANDPGANFILRIVP